MQHPPQRFDSILQMALQCCRAAAAAIASASCCPCRLLPPLPPAAAAAVPGVIPWALPQLDAAHQHIAPRAEAGW